MSQIASSPLRSAIALSWLLSPAAGIADTVLGTPPLDMPAPASREVPTEANRPVDVQAHWDNDFIGNLHGGIQRGTAFDSTAQLSLTINGDAIGWPGATFYAAVFGFRTGKADERLIGDRLGASNIEAQRNGLAMAAAHWNQQWHPGLSTQLGLFDLNSVFDVTDSAAQLLNGSFGLDPTLTDNFDASTFPRSGSGGVAQWTRHHLNLKVGLFQGEVDRQTHPFADGALGVIEAGWQRGDDNAKLGLWQKRGGQTPDLEGIYFSGEKVLTGAKRPLVGFVRASRARGRDGNPAPGVRRYIGIGFNWQGLLAARPRDHLTAGFGEARLSDGGSSAERVAELAYIFRVHKRVYLQPDIQYIHRPDGSLPSAWVATLRVHLE